MKEQLKLPAYTLAITLAVIGFASLVSKIAAAPISREVAGASIAVTASSTTSATIDSSTSSGGLVVIPTGSGLTSFTWYASADGVTFVAAYDETGVAITQTVAAARAYEIPASLFGARYLRIVGNTAGTVAVSLKS